MLQRTLTVLLLTLFLIPNIWAREERFEGFWSGGANPGVNTMGEKPYNGSHGPTSATGFGGQQPVADLLVDFGHPVAQEGFRRELDFEAAEARVSACATANWPRGESHGVVN